jgi:ABC-2 type transport system permease protein
MIRPEQLMRAESLPDLTGFFSTLQSPLTPLLPSFWAGELLFASLKGGWDPMHAGALWSTALVCCVGLRVADERWHFSGYSRSQEAPEGAIRALSRHRSDRTHAAVVAGAQATPRQGCEDLPARRQPVVQLLLLSRAGPHLPVQLPRAGSRAHSVHERVREERLRAAESRDGGFVLATVAVRFVFPMVSAEGRAFWLIRKSPVAMHDFLWSKFWTGFVPVLLLTETLTVAANELLDVDPFLKSRRRHRDCVLEPRPRWARYRSGARYHAVHDRQSERTGRLIWRRRVHDRCRPPHHRDHRAWSAGLPRPISITSCATGRFQHCGSR